MTEWTRRVLVVEDDSLMSTLLRDVLNGTGFLAEVAPDVERAKRLLKSFDPDVVLLDISLGQGPTGIDLAYVIKRQRPDVGVLFLTQFPDLRTAGVSAHEMPPGCGFVHKSMISDTGYLIAAIESVLADAPDGYRTDLSTDRPLSSLTRAQLDVLRMAALGMTNIAIARERGTTERTVERILAAVFQALNIEISPDVNPRVEAIRCYIAAAGLPTRREQPPS